MINVKQHKRGGKNKVSVVRKYSKKGSTHKTVGGKKYVFVDNFWKHDDYPDTPKEGWGYEKLMAQRQMYQKDLADGLAGRDILPPRKLGLLTRRIKKINRFLKGKTPKVK
jgi:hypothetical protein